MEDNNTYESLYSRNNNAGNTNKTILMDFDNVPANIFIPPIPQPDTEAQNRHNDVPVHAIHVNGNRKIIGVLFSVSHFSNGEVFPIYEGANTIGRNADNDIQLQEASIDEYHAVLYATHDDYPGTDYIITIHDQGSSFGTMVGGDEVIFNQHSVYDNDILFVGNHYQLIAKLFQQEAHKLFTTEAFQPTGSTAKPKTEPNEELPPEAIPSIEFYTPSQKSRNNTITKSY